MEKSSSNPPLIKMMDGRTINTEVTLTRDSIVKDLERGGRRGISNVKH